MTNDEWYTPARYVDAARAVMGGIDLDPASCEEAQRTVQAGAWIGRADGGLRTNWRERVWLNPPYSVVSIWVDKLLREIVDGRVTQAILLTNAATDTIYFHRAANACSAICLTKGRTRFVAPGGVEGPAPRFGSAFFYFGPRIGAFRSEFSKFGFVMAS